jgi:hypothetical protein
MKKLVSIILVLALCLSAVAALAEAVPSKTTGDLVSIECDADVSFVIDTDNEWALEELNKLIAAPSIPDYFGDVIAEDGAIAPLADDKGVDEFFAVEVSNYDEEDGDVELIMKVPGPYELGEEVTLLVGILEEDNTVSWYSFAGEAIAEDAISVKLPQDAMEMIQEAGTVLFAVVSVVK